VGHKSGHRICAIRMSLGFSQEYVARHALGHATGSYLSKVERGLQDPGEAVLTRILAVLGILNPQEFIHETEHSCSICRRPITMPLRPRGIPAYFYEGSLFCASGFCPDAGKIPAACPSGCSPGEDPTPSCSLINECPCAHPATPEREAAYRRWVSSEYSLRL